MDSKAKGDFVLKLEQSYHLHSLYVWNWISNKCGGGDQAQAEGDLGSCALKKGKKILSTASQFGRRCSMALEEPYGRSLEAINNSSN